MIQASNPGPQIPNASFFVAWHPVKRSHVQPICPTHYVTRLSDDTKRVYTFAPGFRLLYTNSVASFIQTVLPTLFHSIFDIFLIPICTSSSTSDD